MKKIFLIFISCFIVSCASQVVKIEELKQIKTVAIVGFSLEQQKSVSGTDLLSIAFKTNEPSGANLVVATDSPRAESAYRKFSTNLSAKTGWKIMPIENLRKNSSYIAYVKSKTEGFQNRPMINDRYDLIKPAGIIDKYSFLMTENKLLADLAKNLGVDAVVASGTKIDLNANGLLASMVGSGEYKPSGTTTVVIKDAKTGDNLVMMSAEGPQVEKGEKNTLGISDEDNLNKLVLEATNLSVEKTMKDFPQIL
jgi:lysophospholipid acyltransferase (LPLAT)-like uncharacterized protein